ncbi:MAG: AbrB/MazE/SpoVT family DNA-binding domain-containing protein [Patescibacteria group bacterium]
MRRELRDKNTRKILKIGNSYAVTVPLEIIQELGWKKKQKVFVRKRGKGVVIEDWE